MAMTVEISQAAVKRREWFGSPGRPVVPPEARDG
jgi:hypothetical protein